MAGAAREEARRLGCPVTAHVKVPGVFDTPLAAKMLLQRPDVEAVVVIGCVIQGETGHDVLITNAAAKQILELACAFDKPIGLGVTGPRMTREQAVARIQSGAFAVASAVAQVRLLRRAS
jgi:6,7-dimethyl-8-ribityllumazine synthase